jgi:hypothetical protein
MLDQIFGYEHGKKVEQYPTTHVNARRISLSWDLRDATNLESPIVLNGRMHHLGLKSGNRSREPASLLGPLAVPANAIKAFLAKNEGERDLSSIKLTDFENMLFYHLRDPRRLVGEMCIQSRQRWPPLEDWRFNELLNAATTDLEYISSQGLGKRVEKGLRSIEQDKFEAEEEQIQRTLWDT